MNVILETCDTCLFQWRMMGDKEHDLTVCPVCKLKALEAEVERLERQLRERNGTLETQEHRQNLMIC